MSGATAIVMRPGALGTNSPATLPESFTILSRIVMRYFPILCAAGLGLGLLSSSVLAADIVARVGKTEVSIEEVQALIDSLPQADQDTLTKTPQALSQVVRLHLARLLVLKEALANRCEQ